MGKAVVTLKVATNVALENLTQEVVGKMLGVSRDQVYKYSVGYTVSCKDKVADAFYDNFDMLLDYWKDEVEYLKLRAIRERYAK